MSTKSTVFLDRDGVINRNRPDYVKSWDEFQFLPGAARGIARLTRAGYRLFVITNQACVGKGLVPWVTVEEIHSRMVHEIELAGGRIEGVLCCPHPPGAGCDCRKPAPGLLLRAQREFDVDLSHAIFVGDGASDVRAAAAVGAPSILVLSGRGWRTALTLAADAPLPCQLALNLAHAARLIRIGRSAPPRETAWLRRLVNGGRAVQGYAAVWRPEGS